MAPERPIIICSRGSALALAQSNWILAACRQAFPRLQFELKIIKTTGDKLQKASMAKPDPALPKGLFTKELEVALLKGRADLAVHSLKDLPTDLPAGLIMAATPKREDVRDVLIYRAAPIPAPSAKSKTKRTAKVEQPAQADIILTGFAPHLPLKKFPRHATIATSSTRRRQQLLAVRPDLNIVEIRGNLPTRLKKIAENGALDATVLALAGMTRLNYQILPDGRIEGELVPAGLLATILEVDEMLPCVGQGAIGLEIRHDDPRIAEICERLNHAVTYHSVTAERAFLRGMGGGCQSPVAAYAQVHGKKISLRALSCHGPQPRYGAGEAVLARAADLGRELAEQLK
jgi:hydroxymethylbilane synthase